MRCDDLQAVKASASRLVPEVLHELRVRVSCLVSRVSCLVSRVSCLVCSVLGRR